MKKLFVFLILSACYFISDGQDTTGKPSCVTPATCTNNLTMPISAFAGTTASVNRYYATGCNNINSGPPTSMPGNFHKVTYASGDPGFDGCAGDIKNCTSDGSVLQYRATYPNKTAITNFATCKLPVVIYFHGGSFADCNGTFDDVGLQTIATNFAERGFIFISVEYRRGVKVVSDVYYTVQQMLAIYRACQDARGAIRSIIKHETTTNTGEKETEFHIDVNNIFLAGNSAGSVIAMNVAYYTNQMVIDAFPSGISDDHVLGSIDQNYYYGGDGSVGTGGITIPVKGVLDLWGGVLLPSSYSVSNPSPFFFQNGHKLPPTIAFCGKFDNIFDYVSKSLQFPFSPSFTPSVTSESYCLNDPSGVTSYTVSAGTNYGNILGSQTIYEMLHNPANKIFTEFYLDCQMKHGLDNDCTQCNPGKKRVSGLCKQCYFSDFGVAIATDVTSTNLYIVQRAATFFQAVMNDTPPYAAIHVLTTKFVECQNNRYGCSPADNNNGCPTDANASQQVCSTQ